MTDNNDRLGDALAWAAGIQAAHEAEVSESRAEAASARWANHTIVPQTTIRVSVTVRDRVQDEVPSRERREFVDGAITRALDARKKSM